MLTVSGHWGLEIALDMDYRKLNSDLKFCLIIYLLCPPFVWEGFMWL